jgi:uroporphyrinogen-III synthase
MSEGGEAAAPLRGRRILVTRRPEQSETLVASLRALGATVVEVPLLEIAPPLDPGPLDAALRQVAAYDWIAFTSANAVRAVAERWRALGESGRPPRVASVGPATSRALGQHLPAWPVDRAPAADYRAEGLLAAFQETEVRGRRFLLPVSDRARDVLAEGLAAGGARVDRVTAYRTIAPADAGPALARALADGVDVVTFASPSAVETFTDLAPQRGAGVRAAVIGPVTEARARALGLDVVVSADPATAEGLAASLGRALTR